MGPLFSPIFIDAAPRSNKAEAVKMHINNAAARFMKKDAAYMAAARHSPARQYQRSPDDIDAAITPILCRQRQRLIADAAPEQLLSLSSQSILFGIRRLTPILL